MKLSTKRCFKLSILLLFLLPAGFASQAQPVARVEAANISVEYDDLLRSHVISRLSAQPVEVTDWSASESVSVAGNEVVDFRFRGRRTEAVHDDLGTGNRLILTGETTALRKEVLATAYRAFPSAIVLTVRYTNMGKAAVAIEGWTNHNYRVLANGTTPNPFWSFQSGSYESRPSWVLPLKEGFHQDNFQGMNSQDYGGGTPVVDIWRRDVGIGIGHLELTPKLVSLPVAMPDPGFATLALHYASRRVLQPGESLTTFRSFVTVHNGDYFRTLREYRNIMVAQGVRMPESPPEAFEPIWCAWGYRRGFRPSQIYGALPEVTKLGFGWVTLDDGWQTAEGDWYLNKEKFPAGDTDMKAMVDRIHARGFKAQLWWAPMSVSPDTDLIRSHPEQLLLNQDGSPHKVTYWNAFYLCPAVADVRRDAARFVTKAIKEWGFDGLKLDGQFMNAAPLCYNPAHHHVDAAESAESVPKFFKAIYDAAIAAKPKAVVEFCPCGTAYSFFTMPYFNMAVASDPEKSWQVRSKGKSLKALLGDSVAYFGDHVELSDEGQDFASSVGLGAVVGTEFTWPVGSGPPGRDGRRRGDLTPDREQHWAEWLAIYREKMLPRGEYLGELYDIGYDVPETHVIRKGAKLYYSFYAPEFEGKVELRGLAHLKYRVVDYENGRQLGTVQGPLTALAVKFRKHLLIEANPE